MNIPGAVFPTYTIPNAQPRDGGSYDVLVANGFSVAQSDLASVVITSPALPLVNDFASRLAITGTSGVGSGSNVGAGKETAETSHVGKIGGASCGFLVLPLNSVETEKLTVYTERRFL